MAQELSHKAKNAIQALKQSYVFYPDFPKKGVNFWDVFSLVKNEKAANLLYVILEEYAATFKDKVDVVVALEARGFVFGSLLAYLLKCSFTPIRKKGKLPGKVLEEKYILEYNEDIVEMQDDSIKPGQRVIIFDDCIATGGTMTAAHNLVEKFKGVIVDCVVLYKITEVQSCVNFKVTVLLE